MVVVVCVFFVVVVGPTVPNIQADEDRSENLSAAPAAKLGLPVLAKWKSQVVRENSTRPYKE